MTNTLTISRELAQKIDDLLYIMTGHDSYPRLVHKYGKEWWTPINEMRAEICTLLATPAFCICRGCFTEQPSGTACVTCAKVEAERAAPVVERQPTPWSYCPECGSQKLHHEEGEHKQCANCHQEWFSDIDYSEVVRGNLEKLKSSPPAPVTVAMVELLKRVVECGALTFDSQPDFEVLEAEICACLDKVKASQPAPVSVDDGGYEDECGNLRYRPEEEQPNTDFAPPNRYTCIGKGGDYERLGHAKPSGALRTMHGESGIIVYRDIATGQLYFRDPADFSQRMACIDKVKELNQ